MIAQQSRLSRAMRRAGLVAALLALTALGTAAQATVIGVTMVPPIAFFQFLRDGMQAHAATLPGVELKIQFATTGDQQTAQVKDYIAAHVDAVIVLPADAAATADITRMAQDANIPLVYVNNGPREDWFAGRVALALPNDLVAGRVQMDKLAQLMGGHGRLAIIRGPSSHSAAQLRTQGVKEVLAQFPGITVVEEDAADWDRKRAQDMVAGWLAKSDHLDAIAANNDEMAIGAAAALAAANLPPGQILVGGVDATPDGLRSMQTKEMAVTLFQDPVLEGSRALDDVLKLARGETVQQYDWVPFELVTPATLQHFVAK